MTFLETETNDWNNLLFKYTGYEKLKPEQIEILTNLLNNEDVVGLLPTGFGKSLIFIMHFLLLNENVMIVCPLLALMHDQKTQLEAWNIPVICLNSKNTTINDDLLKLYSGFKAIIYTTPEYLAYKWDIINKLSLKLFVIDECHCISHWGYDFRQEYINLNKFRTINDTIPILCLTATGTNLVIKDIIKVLQLKTPKIVKASLAKKNLHMSFYYREKNIIEQLMYFISKFKNEKIIIYCNSKANTDDYAHKLSENGIDCMAFHADKPNNYKENLIAQFKSGEIKIITSTIAFGMGINIKDIHVDIHTYLPKNLSQYVQEIGRIGRDNLNCYSILLYHNSDIKISEFHINKITDPEMRKYNHDLLKTMKSFVSYTQCRQQFIINYFNDSNISYSCNKCDNCVKDLNYYRNFTSEYRKIYLTITNSDLIKNKLLLYLTNLNIYSEKWWSKFIDILFQNNFLYSNNLHIKPTDSGIELFASSKIIIVTDSMFQQIDSDFDVSFYSSKHLSNFNNYLKSINVDITLTFDEIESLSLNNMLDILYLLIKLKIPINDIKQKLNLTNIQFNKNCIKLIQHKYIFNLHIFDYTYEIYSDLTSKSLSNNTDISISKLSKFHINLTNALNTYMVHKINLYFT